MKVLTFNKQMLVSSSEQLAHKVLTGSDWSPDLVIGIKTGGIYISKPLYQKLLLTLEVDYTELSLSRPSTKKKKTLKIDKILKRLPYFLLNILRNIEVFSIEFFKEKDYNPYREQDLILEEQFVSKLPTYKNILLVDDAIDTGTTVLAIKNRLLAINPNLSIRTAVLTITHNKPYLDADYFLYSRVLLRCPWAADYKGD